MAVARDQVFGDKFRLMSTGNPLTLLPLRKARLLVRPSWRVLRWACGLPSTLPATRSCELLITSSPTRVGENPRTPVRTIQTNISGTKTDNELTAFRCK